MSDANKTVEDAIKVLDPLIKDYEKLAHDPDLSPRARNDLIKLIAGWKVELASGRLSVEDMCLLIEELYSGIIEKKQGTRFDAYCPASVAHMEAGRAFVIKTSGVFGGNKKRGVQCIDMDF